MMIDHDVMPLIAIGGGCAALFGLLCIVLLRGRRRVVEGPRKTSFYVVAIDPSVAEQGRAAFETPATTATAATQLAPVITPYVQVPAIDPPQQPRRIARGSAPGIARTLPARPQGWEQHEPSVTAQMRAARRTH